MAIAAPSHPCSRKRALETAVRVRARSAGIQRTGTVCEKITCSSLTSSLPPRLRGGALAGHGGMARGLGADAATAAAIDED